MQTPQDTFHFSASLLMKEDSGNWTMPPQNLKQALARVQQSYAMYISYGTDLWNFGEQLKSANAMKKGLSLSMQGLLENYEKRSIRLLDPVSV